MSEEKPFFQPWDFIPRGTRPNYNDHFPVSLHRKDSFCHDLHTLPAPYEDDKMAKILGAQYDPSWPSHESYAPWSQWRDPPYNGPDILAPGSAIHSRVVSAPRVKYMDEVRAIEKWVSGEITFKNYGSSCKLNLEYIKGVYKMLRNACGRQSCIINDLRHQGQHRGRGFYRAMMEGELERLHSEIEYVQYVIDILEGEIRATEMKGFPRQS